MSSQTTRPQIVFMGSGPVAARSLELLLEWCDVEVVITKPKPAHHKYEFPVVSLAEARGLSILFANNQKELDHIINESQLHSRVAVLIDYGIIVSQTVIDSFPLGIINSHFSLLPEWRGADPITFAILSGQAETGVSLMMLVRAMDEGPLLAQAVEAVSADDTTISLTAKLIELSDGMLRETLPYYYFGIPHPDTGAHIEPIDQSTAVAMQGRNVMPTYSRKLTKQDGLVNPAKAAVVLEREIRAYAEWPKSYMNIGGKDVTVVKAEVFELTATAGSDITIQHQPGDVFALPGKQIGLQTADGILAISELKPAGKQSMSAAAFLAGNSL